MIEFGIPISPDNPIDEGIVVPIGPEDNADSESKEDE
jgi:hypothetical protein